jgi:hypothetical protein
MAVVVAHGHLRCGSAPRSCRGRGPHERGRASTRPVDGVPLPHPACLRLRLARLHGVDSAAVEGGRGRFFGRRRPAACSRPCQRVRDLCRARTAASAGRLGSVGGTDHHGDLLLRALRGRASSPPRERRARRGGDGAEAGGKHVCLHLAQRLLQLRQRLHRRRRDAPSPRPGLDRQSRGAATTP